MSEPIKDGGSAFPLKSVYGYSTIGMTLRDYFAAKAISAFALMIVEDTVKTGKPQAESAAETAYSIADAMIKARGL